VQGRPQLQKSAFILVMANEGTRLPRLRISER